MRKLILLSLLLPVAAHAVVIPVQLSECSPDSTLGAIRTTAYPAGNCPIPGTACSAWTCAQKGDAAGEINEVSATALDISASGTNTLGNIDYAYQTRPDSGDIQVKVQVPSSFTGYVEDFTPIGVGITEGTADGDWFAQCWCPDVGAVRFTSGTPGTNTTAVGTSGSCYSKYLALTFDDSESELQCLVSDDNITWNTVGTAVSRSLTCTAGNCPAYVWGTSNESGQTTFMSATNAETSTTITATGTPGPSPQEILYDGGFESGDYSEYLSPSGETITFWQMPPYGRPVQYGGQDQFGNGDLAALVRTTATGLYEQGPVACGNTAARFTVKNAINETEPDDWDPVGGGTGTEEQRRVLLTMVTSLNDNFPGALPDAEERWIGHAVYVPSDWDTVSETGWGITVFELKPYISLGSPAVSLTITDGETWNISHRVSTGTNSTTVPWQWQTFYGTDSGNVYPSTGAWPAGLDDYPVIADSRAALASLNRGGWTYWVMNILPDHTAPSSGKLDIWKKEVGGHDWIKVLEIRPVVGMARGGITYDRGIAMNEPNGYGHVFGLYGDTDRFRNAVPQREVFHDCTRVGSANSGFVDVSPDGTVP